MLNLACHDGCMPSHNQIQSFQRMHVPIRAANKYSKTLHDQSTQHYEDSDKHKAVTASLPGQQGLRRKEQPSNSNSAEVGPSTSGMCASGVAPAMLTPGSSAHRMRQGAGAQLAPARVAALVSQIVHCYAQRCACTGIPQRATMTRIEVPDATLEVPTRCRQGCAIDEGPSCGRATKQCSTEPCGAITRV